MENHNEFLKKLQSASVPQNRSFKAKLKEALIARAEQEYPPKTRFNPWLRALRIPFSVLILTLIITQIAIPSGDDSSSTNALSAFIQEAKASYPETEGKIYHAKIKGEMEYYFESETFKGWQTVSIIEKDMWTAPNGELRQEMKISSFNGPNEFGDFEQVDQTDLGLSKKDSYGNIIPYTLLQITGTTDGSGGIDEPIGEPIYNVHPGKQYDDADLSKQFLNQITCVTKEAGEDFDAYAWSTINKDSLISEGLIVTSFPHDNKYKIVDELFEAASGSLSSQEVIAILEKVQDEPQITYETIETNGVKEVVISLNTNDFMPINSSSKEDLIKIDRKEENLITIHFNQETHQLISMKSEVLYDGIVQNRSSTTVVSYEYLDYEANKALFETNEDFVASPYFNRFEQNIEDFEPGCYEAYLKLPDEEAKEWLEQIKSQFTEANMELWNHPLSLTLGYYRLPGENEIKGEGFKK
ncbi:hypothetical protein IPG41_01795 [Candidatus Peregrinibacteria bacterium]|nr:MAG: hypothetical protein IPG41_01795 [Candidatus Peregrinibacteria bacterium]